MKAMTLSVVGVIDDVAKPRFRGAVDDFVHKCSVNVWGTHCGTGGTPVCAEHLGTAGVFIAVSV